MNPCFRAVTRHARSNAIPTPFHAIPSGLEELGGMAWNWSAAAWLGAVELDVDWNCHSSIGIGWRGMVASLQPMELEWRGVNSGKISGLALDCTIPTAIPLAWRGVTLNTILELGRNCAILKQFLERERGVTYRAVRLRG